MRQLPLQNASRAGILGALSTFGRTSRALCSAGRNEAHTTYRSRSTRCEALFSRLTDPSDRCSLLLGHKTLAAAQQVQMVRLLNELLNACGDVSVRQIRDPQSVR